MKYTTLILLIFVCGKVFAQSVNPATLHGKVFDKKTNEKKDGKVAVFYDSDVEEFHSGKIEDGEFKVPLEEMGWYIVSITAPGYLELTDSLWVVNDHKGTVNKDYYLTPIEVGLTVAFKNIYFTSTKATLTEESYPALNDIIDFFTGNPHIMFEIAGHTDSYGEDDYNLMLSQGRAQAVVDYLCSRGVDRAQLKAKGYGETKPIDTTGTRAGLAKNRRVEFTVLSIADIK